MRRDTVLFYCQHLLGIGHISRSLAICRALLDSFDVVFVQGGPDIGRTIDAPGFTHVFLPPLLMQEEDSSLYDPLNANTVEEIWAARRAALEPTLSEPFSAVVVELFPFGRNKFKPEIFHIITSARTSNPHTKVFCSNRDIMVRKPDQEKREEKIVKILGSYFDYLLVHSDPAVIRMEETFGATGRIASMMRYTGFVTGIPREPIMELQRKPRLLVSLGGGAVGDELAYACLAVANEFPAYEMIVLTGPYTTKSAREKMEKLAASTSNTSVRGFSESFQSELSHAALSISLAGYNTLMDILASRTPALVYPYMANHEQSMRATALGNRGFLGILKKEDLIANNLTAAIKQRLSVPYPSAKIDLTGAQKSAELIAGCAIN